MSYKLGSLFDGSGGFPLAGALCGIEPVWASEVEPYPIAVTRSRFPKVKHLGDISKINGAEIEPVDIITFGSPCQDLSVAGKRAGLKHEANGDEETTRSGLFMEAVRIIKEMRRATNGQFPRFALWENVPGAFSSNKGEDFRIVCEELIKIVEPSATMPSVPKNGWAYADSYIGDGWSLAYRVFNAQYWGVPQRRRRIHLIADFRGERAKEVLFERQGVRGYFEEGRTPWQTAPTDAQDRTGANDPEGEGFDGYNGGLTGDKASTLGVNCGVSTGRNGAIERRQLDAVAYSFDSLASNSMKSSNPHSGCRAVALSPVAATLRAGAGAPKHESDFVGRLCLDTHILDDQGGSVINVRTDGQSTTLRAQMGGHLPIVMNPEPVICLQGNGIDRADTAGCNGKGWKEDTCYTLNTIDRPAVVFAVDQGGGKSSANVTENKAPTLATIHGGAPAVAFHLLQDPVNSEKVTPCLSSGNPTNGQACVGVVQLASGNPTVGTLMANAGTKLWTGNQEIFSGDYSIIEAHTPDFTGVDCRNATEYQETTGALQAGCGHNLNSNNVVRTNYIVRRLTPTECARLQGFADQWGHVAQKDTLTAEEHNFWLEVRNTHAAINGRAVKEYTLKQMLTWYNKLWTDSAEYKMWGNGIALPPALYCMQGIVDVLNAEEDDAWML